MGLPETETDRHRAAEEQDDIPGNILEILNLQDIENKEQQVEVSRIAVLSMVFQGRDPVFGGDEQMTERSTRRENFSFLLQPPVRYTSGWLFLSDRG